LPGSFDQFSGGSLRLAGKGEGRSVLRPSDVTRADGFNTTNDSGDDDDATSNDGGGDDDGDGNRSNSNNVPTQVLQ
jgi:hypothetical protein